MKKFKIITLILLSMPWMGYAQWAEKNVMTNASLTSVDFINNDLGFVTGYNEIFKTENGGDNWILSHKASDFVIYEDIFAINKEVVIAVGKDLLTNLSIITKTENGGVDWSEINIDNFSFLKSLFFINANVGYCSGSNGAILKTLDSGDTWQSINSGTGLNLESIYFVNEMVGIAVGGTIGSALILKTKDGGETWQEMDSPSDENLQSVFFSSPEIAYVVGWKGEILKTEDCGDNWVRQNSVAMTGNLRVIFTDENTGYIVGGSMNESLIQKTTNGGDLWEDISPQFSQGLICVDFPSLNVGYAVGSKGIVAKTTTAGIMTSTNNLHVQDEIKLFPNPFHGILHVASDINIYIDCIKIYDTNGHIIKEIKPNATKTSIDLSNLASNVYYVETHASGKTQIKKIIKK